MPRPAPRRPPPLLNAIDDARERAAIEDALKRFGFDPASAADVAAARAYVWAIHFGPLRFAVPWSGPETERVAEAIMRAERVGPGTLTRALGGDRDALAALDRAVRAAKEPDPAPARPTPGSGIETRNDEERALVAAMLAQGKDTQEILAALADLRSKQGEAGHATK